MLRVLVCIGIILCLLCNPTAGLHLIQPRENPSDWLSDYNATEHLSEAEFSPDPRNPLNMSSCIYFPRTVVVGTQKAATTYLHSLMTACKAYCFPWKEVHMDESMFLADRLGQETLCQDYKKLYDRRQRLCSGSGDILSITPSLMLSRHSARVFKESNTRVFVILRDPIERMVSAINMEYGRKGPGCELDVPAMQQKLKNAVNVLLHGRKDKWSKFYMKSVVQHLDDMFMKHEAELFDFDSLDSVVMGHILYSLYDRFFYVYSSVPVRVIMFDDITNGTESFSSDLEELFVGNHREETIQCIRRNLKNLKLSRYSSDVDKFKESDLPDEVREYVQSRNRWYYEHRPK